MKIVYESQEILHDIYKYIANSMVDVEAMDVDVVGRNELLIPRTDLDFHASTVTTGMSDQNTSDASRTAKVDLFTLNLDLAHQVHVVDAVIRHDDEYTREICMLMVRDALSLTVVDHDLIPSFVMRYADFNMMTALKF